MNQEIALDATLDLLGHHRGMILMSLMEQTKRFGVLQKELNGISAKALSANLRLLESEGLLTRAAYAEVPPRVEYTLTEAGRALQTGLELLSGWGVKYYREAGRE